MQDIATDPRTGARYARGLVQLVVVAALGALLAACGMDGAEGPTRPDAAAPGAGPSDPRTVEERLQDATLAAQIRKALLDTLTLRAFDFEAEVQGGRVALRGTVHTAGQRALAEAIARDVRGIRAFYNGVVVSADSTAGHMPFEKIIR